MASSSAAWVLGGVRLISSASNRLVNTGPERNSNSAVRASYTSEPVTSPGIRSGVNCTRLNSSCSAAASVRTSSVLATPGTPSSSTWPRHSSAITRPLTTASWPTTALAISLRKASNAFRAVSSTSAACLRCWLSHDCATCLSMLSSSRARLTRSASLAGGGPNSVCATVCGSWPHRWATASDDRGRLRRSCPRPRRGSIRCSVGGAQRIGGAVAGPPRPVQPAAALDGLRGAHHDRQLLGDQRADASALPQREQRDDQAQLQDDPRHLVGDEIG